MSSATLTGRTSLHRGLSLRCPGCAASMRAVDLVDTECEVDVCDACGGIWVDWFDGEVRKVASEAFRISEPSLKAAEPADAAEHVTGSCPRCSKHLVAERYVVPADVPSPEIGAELLRCEDCMGAFVARASAEALAAVDIADEAPASMGAPPSLRPLPWPRFVYALKGLFGMK